MKKKLAALFPRRWQDGVCSIVLMVSTVDISLLLQPIGADENHASLIMVLGVLFVSRFTNGYFYGTVSALVAAVLTNYIFMSPYYQFELQDPSYTMTFVVMLCVAMVTSTMTSHIKKQEQIQIEAERERLRANLMRSMGHDLRTPLTSIIGCTDAILDTSNHLTQDEVYNLLVNMRDEAEWMISMVENLLSVTRVGGASCQLTKRPEVPEEIVGEVLEKFEKHYPSVSVDVEVPDTWIEIPMDGMLIEQVLYNLMENAAVHGQASEIRVTVTCDRQYARFTVDNNGQGIPEDRLKDLGTAFMNMTDTNAGDQKQNMGIGVMVCRDIIRAHQGEFGIRNLPEGGAEAYFTLPMEEEQHGTHQR